MQNVPEAAHRHNTSTNSVKSIVEIGKHYRIPIEGSNSSKVLKRTKKGNADLMTSLAEESST